MKALIPMLALLLSGHAAAAAQGPAAVVHAQPPEVSAVAQGGNAFAIDLYRQLAVEPGNLFVSPVSLSTAFGLIQAGARGETADEIARTLHYPAPGETLHADLSRLLSDLRTEQEGRRLAIANALWIGRDLAIDPTYLELAREHYSAVPFAVDFARREETAERINRWAADNTEGRIRDLLSPDDVNADMRSILTNAVYFNADWERPFDARSTAEGDFHTADAGVVRVPFMRQRSRFPYFETQGLQAIELPYRGGEFAMAIFLPRQRDGLADLEAGLTPRRVQDWLNRLATAETAEIQLSLPKLKLERRYMLTPALQALGMVTPFTARADFSAMADAALNIQKVIHQTFLEVDEQGTEAAAVTAVTIVITGARVQPPPIAFDADRPFFFLIRHRPTGSIIFTGRIERPDPR